MLKFKDLNITPTLSLLTGDKIRIKEILNAEIIVLKFTIQPSTKKPGTDYLKLQLKFKEEIRVIFTSAVMLIDTLKAISEESFPFVATIVNDKGYYEFN